MAENSDEPTADTTEENSVDADTSELQRTLENIDALLNQTDITKTALPIEKCYSKMAVATRGALALNTFRRDPLKCGQQFPKASVRVVEHAYKEGRFAGNACVVGIFIERRLI